MLLSDDGVVRSQADFALVAVILIPIKPHIPIFSPECTPAILQKPVVFFVILHHSHQQHGVVDVDVLNRVAVVEDAFVIKNEWIVGRYCHSDWPLVDNIAQTLAIVELVARIGVTSNFELSLALVALSLRSLPESHLPIRVTGSSSDPIYFDEVEDIAHPASLATSISEIPRTVHYLLDGKAHIDISEFK